MKARRVVRAHTLLLGTVVCVAVALAAGDPWEDKEASKWSEKEAKRVLEDSPWGKRVATKIEYQISSDKAIETGAQRTKLERGEATPTEFAQVVWWSAKTPRRAFLRLIQLKGSQVSDEQAQQFAETNMPQHIITVWVPAGMLAAAAKLEPQDLKKTGWLDSPRRNKRIPVEEVLLEKNCAGTPCVRYSFPRELEGQPTVTIEDKRLVFKFQLPGNPREKVEDAKIVEAPFSPAKMTVRGQPDF